MNRYTERVYNSIVKENPTFVLALGMCSTLAVTISAMSGLGMGLGTIVVLTTSNFIMPTLRKIIPDGVRIPVFIVIVALLVIAVQLLIQVYIPLLYDASGTYIPLIVVNCIIPGHTESYASKSGSALLAFNDIGMEIDFSITLAAIGAVRGLIGSDSILGLGTMLAGYEVISISVLTPGTFFVLAVLTALQSKFKAPSATNGPVVQSKLVCGGDCMSCSSSSCMSSHGILETRRTQTPEDALKQKKTNVAKAQVKLDAATARKD